MVSTSLERKTRGDVYGNMKKIIDDAIDVGPWITEKSLKCSARRKKQKVSNNQLIDKEEAKTDKREHQTPVLGIIYTTAVNGGRPKGLTLKNSRNSKERMEELKLHITCLFYRASKL